MFVRAVVPSIILDVYGCCQNAARPRMENRKVSIKQQTHSLYQTKKISNEGGKTAHGKDILGKTKRACDKLPKLLFF